MRSKRHLECIAFYLKGFSFGTTPARVEASNLRLCVLARLPEQRIEAASRDPPMQLAAEGLLAETRGFEQRGEIDAGANAERLEQIDQILGADVAGVAATILHLRRMAAAPAERAIEVTHSRFIGRQRVDQAGSARVVEMCDQGERRRFTPQPAD